MKMLGHTDELLLRLRNMPQQIFWKLGNAMAFGRWMPAVTLCFMALSVWSFAYVLTPLREQVLESVAHLENKSLETPKRVTSTQLKPVDIEKWGEQFPQVHERTAILDEIYDAAPRHNIYLTQAQFHWAEKSQAEAKGGLQALEIDMPVKGAYKDIREFIGDVLQHNRSLALEAMDIARETPTNARLVVSLRFTLYLRGAV